MSTLDLSAFDVIIGVLVLIFALRGLRSGLTSTAFSLAGLVLGGYLGVRAARYLLETRPEIATYSPLLYIGAVIVCAIIGQALAAGLGGRLSRALNRLEPVGPVFGVLDGTGGAAFGAVLGIALGWVLGALALQAPLPDAQNAARESEVLAAVDEQVPSGMNPSDTLLSAASRLEQLPRIQAPAPRVDDPGESSPRELAAARESSESVVRVAGVESSAGGLSGSTGSGWVAAPGLVVTNAHVVGENDRMTVQPPGSWRRLSAEVVTIDGEDDVAVLRVEGLDAPPLPMASAVPGKRASIIGYPGGGPLEIEAGRPGWTREIVTNAGLGGGSVQRVVTSLSGSVEPGNSGGPVLDYRGRVVATIFGSRASGAEAGYAIPSGIVEGEVREAQDVLS